MAENVHHARAEQANGMAENVQLARAVEEQAKVQKHVAKLNEAEGRLQEKFERGKTESTVEHVKEVFGMTEAQKLEKVAQHAAQDAEKHLLRESKILASPPSKSDVA
eukprot:CAMPEP_0184654976 /NCGR_PEP_ID=MMETSP0308-20130426/12622_1 /TAXON_ID=38269 /ORGANISM="Gloeochaete witrockiana, Strain SAG 46.84" /LENGTH=106 /DNA_ID=CAMNT_0027091205 /DNA_START=251 /DNA_END=571 /DNA_ORIENTATION=+